MSKNFDQSVGELIHSIGLLVRRFRAVGRADGFSMLDLTVLKRLEQDGPATTAELARAEGVRPQSMGATIADLEAAEIVERRADPTDGRRMFIQLTAKGTSLREETKLARRTMLAEGIAQLNADEQKILFKAAEILRRLAER